MKGDPIHYYWCLQRLQNIFITLRYYIIWIGLSHDLLHMIKQLTEYDINGLIIQHVSVTAVFVHNIL